jgi:hypothetical protein
MTEEIRELMARALSGDLSPQESERLLAACRADEAVRTELGRLAVAHRLLAASHSEASPEITARELAQRLQAEPAATERLVERVARKAWWTLFGPRLAWAAAIVLVLSLGGWLAFRTRSVATLVRAEATVWSGAALENGSGLRAGHRVEISSGLVEIQFGNGAIVLVEGPANFEIRDRAAAYLYRGRAVAHVPEQARGFVIDSPRGRLVDLGTEFAISVESSGDTEVHVLDGRVDAKLPHHANPVELRANEGLRLQNSGTTWIKADESAFVTELPPRPDETPNFIHWSFDEGSGTVAHNSGRGLAEKDSLLNLRSFRKIGPGPSWQPGIFGHALEFDGIDAFAECNYRGIPGRQARTVAAWVRIPKNWKPTEGFGILGWGHTAPGRAWQLSPNPLADEGELGRLRIGAGKGSVIGTQDLRDGQWHHVAAVMYGGSRPDTGTHVLLYIDGRLEPASRKSMREILTDPDGANHGLYIARNTGFSGQSHPGSGGAFFRGAVDEVFVVAAALSQEQIVRIMRENKL